MFPLSTVAFPGAMLPLHVFEDRYRALIGDVLETTRQFGTVLISAGSEVGGGDRRSNVGTLLKIEMAAPFDDGRWMLATRAVERIRIVEWLDDDPYPRALIEEYPSDQLEPGHDALGAASSAVRRLRMLLSELDRGPCGAIDVDLGEDPTAASWMACAVAPIGQLDAQGLLEASDPVARLTSLIEVCCGRIGDVEGLLRSTSED
jgi:Lon protease-like protein